MLNDNETQKVINKIAALLAKTEENGSTKQEAIQAAQKAQSLMKKYQIDMSDFIEVENIAGEEREVSRNWRLLLGDTIAKNFCCRFYRRRTFSYTEKLKTFAVFYGRKTDRIIAAKIFDMLVNIIKANLREQKRIAKELNGTAKGVEDAYTYSFIQAVKEELEKQCRALCLVVPDKVNEKIKKEFNLSRREIKSNMYQGTREHLNSVKQKGYNDGKNAARIQKIAN